MVEIVNSLSRLALRPSESESFSQGLSQRSCYFHAASNFAGDSNLTDRSGLWVSGVVGVRVGLDRLGRG